MSKNILMCKYITTYAFLCRQNYTFLSSGFSFKAEQKKNKTKKKKFKIRSNKGGLCIVNVFSIYQ